MSALESFVVITNVAGVPSDTCALVDWIVSTGVAAGTASERNAVRTPRWTIPVVAAVLDAGSFAGRRG